MRKTVAMDRPSNDAPRRPQGSGIDIIPVRLSELPSLMEEFFEPGYRFHRLGMPGHWGGSDLSKLDLASTVGANEFGQTFGFRSPDGRLHPVHQWADENPVIAQRVNFTCSPALSSLWALGTGDQQRRITQARLVSTEYGMGMLQRTSQFGGESMYPFSKRGCLYAAFMRGAAEDQTPRLETTVLIAQQYRLRNGDERLFPLKCAPGVMEEMFTRWEYQRLGYREGTIRLGKGTGIPKSLFHEPGMPSPEEPATVKTGDNCPRRLVGRELFREWRHQAKVRGFGPAEVQRAFELAESLGRIIPFSYNGEAWERGLAIWDTLNRSKAMEIDGPMQSENQDHGPTLF